MRKYYLAIFIFWLANHNSSFSQNISKYNTGLSTDTYYYVSGEQPSEIFKNCFYSDPEKFHNICRFQEPGPTQQVRNSYDYLWVSVNGWRYSSFPIFRASNIPLQNGAYFIAPIYNGPPPPNHGIISTEPITVETSSCNYSEVPLNWSESQLQNAIELAPDRLFGTEKFKNNISCNDPYKVIILSARPSTNALLIELDPMVYDGNFNSIENVDPVFNSITIIGISEDNDLIEFPYKLEDYKVSIKLSNIKNEITNYFLKIGLNNPLLYNLQYADQEFYAKIRISYTEEGPCDNNGSGNCQEEHLQFRLEGPRDPNNIFLITDSCQAQRVNVYGQIEFTNDGNSLVSKGILVQLKQPSSFTGTLDNIRYTHSDVPGMNFSNAGYDEGEFSWTFDKPVRFSGFWRCQEDICPRAQINFSFECDRNDIPILNQDSWQAFIKFDHQDSMPTQPVKIQVFPCMQNIKSNKTYGFPLSQPKSVKDSQISKYDHFKLYLKNMFYVRGKK